MLRSLGDRNRYGINERINGFQLLFIGSVKIRFLPYQKLLRYRFIYSSFVCARLIYVQRYIAAVGIMINYDIGLIRNGRGSPVCPVAA